MNDSGVEKIGLVKHCHRSFKNGVKTAVRLPPSKRAVDPRVMNFWTAFVILFNRHFFPLAAHVEYLEDVVEELMQGQFRRRAAAAGAQMRKTNWWNCSKLKLVGIHCHCWLFVISPP